MKRVDYPSAIADLVGQLKRLPGIGPRSAERIALWLVQSRDAHPKEIARTLLDTAESIRPCAKCGFFSTAEICEICADDSRSADLICVVEQATDILPLERTGVYKGRYHALGGRIAARGGLAALLGVSLRHGSLPSPHPGCLAETPSERGGDGQGAARSNFPYCAMQ